MNRSPTPPAPSGPAPAAPAISLAEVLAQPSYVTSLSQFLAARSHVAALRFWITTFLPANTPPTRNAVMSRLARHIAEIDELIDEQLNEILHHPRFQKLEASWRGLWYLAEQAEGANNVKIRMLDISWAEVVKDIGRAMEFDQSHLFHKIYSEEYGTPGGEPYGVILGDYEISHQVSATHPHDDLSILEGLSQIAAAAFAPFIAGAASEFFGMDDFSGLGQPVNLANILVQEEYIRWRALREKPDSRFVGLTLPRVLVRLPYSSERGRPRSLHFNEQCGGTDNRGYLWGNACYAFGGILIREFANVGWFGHIRGVPRDYLSGGLVTTLPVDEFHTDAAGVAIKPVTEVVITDTVEKELSELGFIPLCQCYDAPYAAFYNNQSIQQPKAYGNNDARVNARLSAMLQHILCGSRVAHYLKIMFREKVGSFASAGDCEHYLRDWLHRYSTGREDLEWEDQARYPLREADVNVREHPAKPGQYLCEIRLRPHYQLDHMVSELELATELSAAR